MKKHIMSSVALAGILFTGGCATKKYVAKTVDPVREKVDTVATQTDKQGQTIVQQGTQISQQGDQIKKQGSDIEQAQTNIAANKERAMAADSRATEAMKKADEANTKSDANAKSVSELRQVVANLDDYKPAGNAVVPFAFGKDTLSTDGKAELDKLITAKPATQRYFIAVEGFTDTIGSPVYNNQLSRRRAEAVTHYLVAKYDIPVYRIHMIGLGEDKPADEGKGRAARAKNRRVEVTFYTASNITTASAGTNQ